MTSPIKLRKPTEDKQMEAFLLRHANVFLPIFIVILLVLIIALVIAFIDISSAHNIAMVESGNYYNHLKDVI